MTITPKLKNQLHIEAKRLTDEAWKIESEFRRQVRSVIDNEDGQNELCSASSKELRELAHTKQRIEDFRSMAVWAENKIKEQDAIDKDFLNIHLMYPCGAD